MHVPKPLQSSSEKQTKPPPDELDDDDNAAELAVLADDDEAAVDAPVVEVPEDAADEPVTEMLDAAAVQTLLQWRFKPGAVPYRKITSVQMSPPQTKEETLIKVPVTFIPGLTNR